MVKQLVLHLGDRKTGSTAIQDALAAGHITSPTTQIFYPATTNHIPLAKTLSVKSLSPQRDMRFTKIAKRIARSDADIAVISAEHFEVVKPALLQEILTRYFPDLVGNIRLIAYVRPHAERLVSNYAEAVKLGQYDGDLHSYHTQRLDKKPLSYTDRFSRWRDVFGAAFTLRPFVRKTLVGGDIVQDFAQFLLGDTPHTVTASPPSNPSMSLQDLAMVRHLQSQIGAQPNMSKFQVSMGKSLGQLLASKQDSAQTPIKLAMHTELAKAVQIAYGEDARALDGAFFAPDTPMQDALQSSYERAVATPQSIAVTDHLSAAAIRMVDVWAGLLCSQSAANGALLRETLKNGPQAAGKSGKTGAAKQQAGKKGPNKRGGKKGKNTSPPEKEFTEDDLLDLF
ncbi:hypothetical protein [Roseobacter sp. N2S]|uniref:hypothetical protein n=1 Tax=Roseobacter sp. N2S TaxID=2663844 RepID=UPI00285B8869|nr:hypothetical protein [Roseobacter sp. N2S]MDR6267633.1 Arc/MetJ family transcription regulator [Roseobacter sp. N2S]